jgi:hypothetical protein
MSFTQREFAQQCARKDGKKNDGGNPHNDVFKPKNFYFYFFWFGRHFEEKKECVDKATQIP